MKKLLAAGLVLLSPFVKAAHETAGKNKFQEPMIVAVLGSAHVTEAGGKMLPAKKGFLLREKVSLATGPKSWLIVALSKKDKLTLAPDSRVSLPVISWDDGGVERIELQKGRMRLTNLAANPRLVVTPLSRDAYSEADLVFDWKEDLHAIQVSVLEGKILFRGEENEDFLPLNTGEEATFQAKLESGEIAYDILLQGRRVVRGEMGPKKPVPPATRKEWNEAFEKSKKALQQAQLAEAKEKARAGAICHKPEGKLNECMWTCENNPKKEKSKCRVDLPGVKCVRAKCDANGEWSDRLEIVPAQSPCEVKPKVQACDY